MHLIKWEAGNNNSSNSNRVVCITCELSFLPRNQSTVWPVRPSVRPSLLGISVFIRFIFGIVLSSLGVPRVVQSFYVLFFLLFVHIPIPNQLPSPPLTLRPSLKFDSWSNFLWQIYPRPTLSLFFLESVSQVFQLLLFRSNITNQNI